MKRFQIVDKTVIPEPENEQFAPIRVENAERFRILGKAIGVFRKL